VMDVRSEPAVRVRDLNVFFRFAEAVFQFRRKQLAAALVRVSGRSRPEVEAQLRQAGIEPERRAETLAIPEWEDLFSVFSA
jgi:16S rRNA (adenine1518-N6/adenine1519-N6)-dimethyltransferase